jgi:alkanesulfonate monooxygenase SsuD/methylene tetrahydromethanopterin reductase-like flavin-dependent oxidoreductase (luciferase family)
MPSFARPASAIDLPFGPTALLPSTMVTSATFRLPGPLAISVAQVDDMSGGRVELGLGAGWFDDEHTAYGIPFPTLGERFDRLEEQLEIITGLWRTPIETQYSFEGAHYTVANPRRCPNPPSRRTRRSSSVAAAPSAHPRWRRSSPPSSTSRSHRWRWPRPSTRGLRRR